MKELELSYNFCLFWKAMLQVFHFEVNIWLLEGIENKSHHLFYIRIMKSKIIWIAVFSFFITACSFEIKKSKAEILFDAMEANYLSPNDSTNDTLISVLQEFNLEELDSLHQKAFWFNAYNLLLEKMRYHPTGYMDFNHFLQEEFTVAKQRMTTKELIQKLESYNDPRVLICLDFYTTTSSNTYHKVLNKDTEQTLDSLCSSIINDPSFIRVKKEAQTVYYPEHFDWHLKDMNTTTTSKEMILKYHHSKEISELKFFPYPFSFKLRD